MDARTALAAPESLSPVDAAWFRMEASKSPADILGLLVLDGHLTDAELQATLERQFLLRRQFRRRIVESTRHVLPPHWEDELPFLLDAHVARRVVPAPGGDAELLSTITELANTPMDFRVSPWRLWVLDGCPGGSVLFVQIHHCMGDGFALIDMLVSLTEHDGGETRPSSAPEPAEHHHLSAVEALGLARRVTHGVADLGHLLLMPFDPVTRLRGTPSGERRLAWSSGVPLATVKAIAKEHGATCNDVLLAALAGALRHYLVEHGDCPEDFRAIVPVNLRPPSQPIDDEHANWFGLVFADLPVHVEARAERLAAVQRAMNRIKASEEPIISLGLLNALGRAPAVVEHVVNDVFAHKASIVVSNVPGPKQDVSLAGHRVRDLLFWVPHPSGLACGASILSYAGMVRVGVRSDAAVVPDPDVIAELFDQELRAWIGLSPGH